MFSMFAWIWWFPRNNFQAFVFAGTCWLSFLSDYFWLRKSMFCKVDNGDNTTNLEGSSLTTDVLSTWSNYFQLYCYCFSMLFNFSIVPAFLSQNPTLRPNIALPLNCSYIIPLKPYHIVIFNRPSLTAIEHSTTLIYRIWSEYDLPNSGSC